MAFRDLIIGADGVAVPLRPDTVNNDFVDENLVIDRFCHSTHGEMMRISNTIWCDR
jgi:hypothetical protein